MIVEKILAWTLKRVRQQARCSKCTRYATRMQRRGSILFCEDHAPTTRSDICVIDYPEVTLLVEKLDEIDGLAPRRPRRPRRPRKPRPPKPKTVWDHLRRGDTV